MRHDRGYFNVSNGGKIHVKGTSRLTYLQGNVSGEGSQVNSKTFFMGVYGSYGGNQYLSVNNGGEVNASEKISLGYYDQTPIQHLLFRKVVKSLRRLLV